MVKLAELAQRYRIEDGRSFRLRDVDPSSTGGLRVSKKQARQDLQDRYIEELSALQEKLYAENRWSLLLIFQAMDAAGKDGTIKHVMSGVNPQGCEVTSFKVPSQQELDHDFMWRTSKALPARGRIGIFNRSYYEEVLVVRVHQEILEGQRLPPSLVTDRIWKERCTDIAAFERYLSRNGTVIRKFFLHISREEQRRRFLDRLDEPNKQWKFSMGDVEERQHWEAYMAAYEDMVRRTATAHAPWHVVPADHKWFARLVVAAAVADTLESLELSFPAVDGAKQKELEKARELLAAEAEQH